MRRWIACLMACATLTAVNAVPGERSAECSAIQARIRLVEMKIRTSDSLAATRKLQNELRRLRAVRYRKCR